MAEEAPASPPPPGEGAEDTHSAIENVPDAEKSVKEEDTTVKAPVEDQTTINEDVSRASSLHHGAEDQTTVNEDVSRVSSVTEVSKVSSVAEASKISSGESAASSKYSDAEEQFEEEEEIVAEMEPEIAVEPIEEIVPEEEVIEEEPLPTIFDILDAPRELPEPTDITISFLKQIKDELGVITLCWPEIKDPYFEGRTNFPHSYLNNTHKEKLLLMYAENFRRQFVFKYPHRKPLFLAADNECGMRKMVCTTLRPTTTSHTEIENWDKCAEFVGDQLNYEPLESPTLIPSRLYSPHTTFLRQSGHSFEIANALCSLLLGLGYDAYMVSGYAVRDVTLRIRMRVDCPFPEMKIEEEKAEAEYFDPKYALKPPRDLRSKFLLAMEQRKIDQMEAEQRAIYEAHLANLRAQEEPPEDELNGQRVHAWILILPGPRQVEDTFFVEPTTGTRYELDTKFYSGIESIWNDINYWVNLQDCSEGLQNIQYDLRDVEKWEHLLLGEPIKWRDAQPPTAIMDAEEEIVHQIYEEKHLDMPISWSQRIYIPHDIIANRFPHGSRRTMYKRTIVEEFAPYVQVDGLVTRVNRYTNMECTPDELYLIEEIYANRNDCMEKVMSDVQTGQVCEYFTEGRDDACKTHTYSHYDDRIESERTITFYHNKRYDGLSKLELGPLKMIEHYVDREDFAYFRDVTYCPRGNPPPGYFEGPRRIVLRIREKFNRDNSKAASDDISCREFDIVGGFINLKFHYGIGKVTASTRHFTKPAVNEMGDELTFNPALTSGYIAEIGAKPPSNIKLFKLLDKQLKEEENCLMHIRNMEDQITEFITLRQSEKLKPKLDISLYNREQNVEFKKGMLEKEQAESQCKERELEEEVDFLLPYLAKLGNPKSLTFEQAIRVRSQCLDTFRQMLVNRANDIQMKFDKGSLALIDKQNWYSKEQDNLTLHEEETYFRDVRDTTFYLHTLEIRLARQRDLSGLRYRAMVQCLDNDPRLQILKLKKK